MHINIAMTIIMCTLTSYFCPVYKVDHVETRVYYSVMKNRNKCKSTFNNEPVTQVGCYNLGGCQDKVSKKITKRVNASNT